MINFFSFILSFILLTLDMANAQEDMYLKLFGNQSIETTIDLIIQNKSVGDIKVKIQGESISAFNSKNINLKLREILKEEYFIHLNESSEWTSSEKLPYKYKYDPNQIKIFMDFPVANLKPIFYSLENNPKVKYAGETIRPAPLGGSVNYILDKSYGDEYFGNETFSAYIDSFVNFNSYVLSANGRYDETLGIERKSSWTRGNINLTKDFEDQKIRLQLGDTFTERFDFMESNTIGGVNIRRQYSINPYHKPYSQGEKEFQIYRRSKVKTFVNGSLVKNEVLSAGNYKLTNLPLVNGLNFVRVEIDDEVSPLQILEFNIPISISILREGELYFSLSSGKKILDINSTRDYSDKSLSSGMFQYGFSNSYSLGAYGKTDDVYSLVGLSHGLSTSTGNYFLGTAYSNNEDSKFFGLANSLTWQYQNIGGEPFNGLSLILRYENYLNHFRSNLEDTGPSLKDSYESNLSFPLFFRMSLSIGGGVSNYQDEDLDKATFVRGTLNFRPINQMSINVYAAKTKDRNSGEAKSLSIYFTWNLGSSNHYISTFSDLENKSNRVSFTRNNSNKLYSPQYTVSANQEGSTQNRVDFSGQLPTPMANFFLKSSYLKDDINEEHTQAGIGMSSSFLFAYDRAFSFGMGRPNSNSFALFKTSKALENQTISMRSTSEYVDTESPLFGDLAVTNLVPYQYREIQLDPTSLDYGTSLEKEKFVLLPTYKSAHLIHIKDKGIKSVQGLLYYRGKPLALKVGRIGETAFFTDRSGYFYIPGIKENSFEIVMDKGLKKKITLKIDKPGIIDLGKIEL